MIVGFEGKKNKAPKGLNFAEILVVVLNPALISSAFIVHSSGIIHSAHVAAAFVVISFSGDGICAENKKGKQ